MYLKDIFDLRSSGMSLDEFQAGKLYRVGEFIAYNGKIYKCTTEHTSANTFVDDISNWTEWIYPLNIRMKYVDQAIKIADIVQNSDYVDTTLNSITYLYVGKSVLNMPVNNYEWVVKVYRRSDTYMELTAINIYGVNTPYTWHTKLYGGTWSNWYKDLTTYDGNFANYSYLLTTIDSGQHMSWRLRAGIYPGFPGAGNSSSYTDGTNGVSLSQAGDENAGIHLGGNYITMWTPMDEYALKLVDEDDGSMKARVSPSGGWSSSSDIRVKNNIEYIERENILDKIEAIKPCMFSYKYDEPIEETNMLLGAIDTNSETMYENLDDERQNDYDGVEDFADQELARLLKKADRLDKKAEARYYGVIAQEVQEYFPECVSEDKEGMLSVDYSKFGLFAIEAVKELKKENEILKERIKAIEDRLGL